MAIGVVACFAVLLMSPVGCVEGGSQLCGGNLHHQQWTLDTSLVVSMAWAVHPITTTGE